MSKKSKHRKIRRAIITSKMKKVIDAGVYKEFSDDDIYVKPCKKAHLAVWSEQMRLAFEGIDDDHKEMVLELMEIHIVKLILLSACYEDGSKLGSVSNEEDIDLFRELDYQLLKELFRASYEVNRLPKGQCEEFLKFFNKLEDIEEIDFEALEESEENKEETE